MAGDDLLREAQDPSTGPERLAQIAQTDRSDLKPFYRDTDSLDLFKDMIGLPDEFIRDGRAIAPEPRTLNFDPRMQDPDEVLSEAEMLTIGFAAQAFIFGDSLSVRQFRRAVEARMSPFNVAVYAARKVILRPSGSLTLSGPPSVLIAGSIALQAGASIVTRTVSRILTEKMAKSSTPETRNLHPQEAQYG